ERDPNVIYYLTVYNEPMLQPAEPEDVDVEGILRGIHQVAAASDGDGPQVQLLASGVAVAWALGARGGLAQEWGVRAAVWSVTRWNELRRDGLAAAREAFINPEGEQRQSYLATKLGSAQGPFIGTSDYDFQVPDQIRAWVPGDYWTLGADGFGFSDTRPSVRRHFLIDTESIVTRALQALAQRGGVDAAAPAQALKRCDLLNVNAGTTGAAGGDARGTRTPEALGAGRREPPGSLLCTRRRLLSVVRRPPSRHAPSSRFLGRVRMSCRCANSDRGCELSNENADRRQSAHPHSAGAPWQARSRCVAARRLLLVGGVLLRSGHERFQFGHRAIGGIVVGAELGQVLQVPARVGRAPGLHCRTHHLVPYLGALVRRRPVPLPEAECFTGQMRLTQHPDSLGERPTVRFAVAGRRQAAHRSFAVLVQGQPGHLDQRVPGSRHPGQLLGQGPMRSVRGLGLARRFCRRGQRIGRHHFGGTAPHDLGQLVERLGIVGVFPQLRAQPVLPGCFRRRGRIRGLAPPDVIRWRGPEHPAEPVTP